ncbi:MAG TPA: ROK family protein [Terriglobales bacterium]|nr:ROK family protein [Terriglobales bacterium]
MGGSHIAGSLFHPCSQALGGIHTLPVRENGSEAHFFLAFESLAARIDSDSVPRDGVAVAIPNPFDYPRGISYMRHKYQQLYGKDLREGLAQQLKCDPSRIHFLNDAAAFLLGELHQGAAIGVSRAIGVTLGTGVGSAFAVGGKIVVTGQGVPPNGEIWNLAYRDLTVEDFISTRAIQRTYQQFTGIHAEVRDIAALAVQDAHARQTFQIFGAELGGLLRHICVAFAPQRIVLGGGISRAANLFLPAAEKELSDPATQLRISNLFERAPLIGAGVSWKFNHTNFALREREPSGISEES